MKYVTCGVVLFVALGAVPPPLAEGQEARIAPPAAQAVPPGSASTSADQRR